MGDFFEMFYEDAEKAAPVLNITLTVRNKKTANDVKMCGLPHHSIAGPISKLLSAGFKVAICDQVEPVSQAKGLVKREVTRILTPGMVYDPDSLEKLSANYLCAFDESHLSFTDVSTGEAFFYETKDFQTQWKIITLLNPVEVILCPSQKEEYFNKKQWENFHITLFEEKPKSLSMDYKELPPSAVRLLSYIQMQQGNTLVIQPFQKKNIHHELLFSTQAQTHLEILKNYQGQKKESLFSAVNRTKTAGGARLLKKRLTAPSCRKEEIEKRLHQVEKWSHNLNIIEKVRTALSSIGDMERQIGKVPQSYLQGRDLLKLAESLHISAKEIIPLSYSIDIPSTVLDTAQAIAKDIQDTIRLDAPAGTSSGGIIKKGISKELDKLIQETETLQQSLQVLEEKEKIKTQIPSLKIRYNNVFGYYIEVTKVHSKKVPNYYIRKQTLTQAERYTTSHLQEIEEKILSSRSLRIEMEKEIFENLKEKIIQALPDLICLARAICEVDLISSLAYLAIEQSYTKPDFSDNGSLHLVNSRHPVVEQKQNHYFVANTIELKAGECLLLTGPNMAGKSTLMRQIALSAILAQAGSFVPAKKALLPIFTKLFTRVGASDSLSQGLSTFMVEMKESGEILNQADEKSLVILDEIGRGTATYDGMSLAQAILEHLLQKKKSIVCFATHYHELTDMTKNFPQIKNAHLSVKEKNGEIEFLYTLEPGALSQSYGIHVARLAGFPPSVIQKAEKLLEKLEQNNK